MNETFATFLLGAFVAILVLVGLIDVSPNSHKNIVENAIKECEKSLPRDQHCKIVALPVDKD
jgi:hypothetical protein